MSFFNFFKKKQEYKSFFPPENFFNESIDFSNPNESLSSYVKIPSVAICCDKISRSIISQRLFFQTKNGEEIEEDFLNKNLKLIFLNFKTKFETVIKHLLLTGNAFFLKQTNTLFSVSTNSFDQLVVLQPNKMKFVFNEQKDEIQTFVCKSGSSENEFVPSEIIHFKQNALFCPLGIGNVEKMQFEAQNSIGLSKFQQKMISSGNKPSCLIVEESNIPAEEVKRRADLLSTSFENHQKSMFYLNGSNVKKHDLSYKNTDMQLIQNKEFLDDLVFEVFGCFRIKEGTNRASAFVKRLDFLENTINPLISLFESVLNEQIIDQHFSQEKIELKIERHNTSDIENTITLLNNGVITPNQASKRLGFEMSDNKGRDGFFYNGSSIPEDNLFFDFEQEEEEEKTIDLSKKLTERLIGKIVSTHFRRSRKEKKFQSKFLRKTLKTKKLVEEHILFRVKKNFERQKQEFLRVFDEKFKIKFFQGKIIAEEFKNKNQYEMEDFSQINLEKERKKLQTILNSSFLFSFEKNIDDLNILFKNRLSLIELSKTKIKENFLKILRKRSEKITKHTYEKIIEKVNQGLSANIPISELKASIEDFFERSKQHRSLTVARTEASLFSQQITKESFKILNVKFFDIIGCRDFETDSDCGKQDLPISRINDLVFHPNHIGTLAPSVEPA